MFVLYIRLLLEATSPHRVIHVNAAFSRKIIAASNGSRRSNAQEWMETQNQPHQISSKNRSIQEALEEIIPENNTLPLTCYPVLGAGSVTHYLIEATPAGPKDGNIAANQEREQQNIDSPHKDNNIDIRQEKMQLYKPFEAVG